VDDNRNLRIGIEVRFQGLQEITLILLEIHWSKWVAGRVKELALLFFPHGVVFLSWCGLPRKFGSVLQSQSDKHPRGDVGDPEAGEGTADVT